MRTNVLRVTLPSCQLQPNPQKGLPFNVCGAPFVGDKFVGVTSKRHSRREGNYMRRIQGFTLIEVMITVAIIAILAAVALPNYSEHIKRVKISDAVAGLSDQRLKMEQFFQDRRTYAGACAANTVAPPPVNTPNFTFNCGTPGNPIRTAYVVTATGIGTMNGFVYTLDQAGNKSSLAPAGWTVTPGCWVLKKDGTC